MANDTVLRTYDPKKISIVWGTIIFTGFADGDFLEIAGEDGFEMRKGADGSEDRTNKNETGKDVNITLMSTSITNDALSAKYEEDRTTNAGYAQLSIKDNNGTMVLFSERAYLKKNADKTLGDSAGTITWNFRAPQAIYTPGSNL